MIEIEETLAETDAALTTDGGLAHGPFVEVTRRPQLERVWPRPLVLRVGLENGINLGHKTVHLIILFDSFSTSNFKSS